MTNIVGFKNSNTQKIKYANVSSVTQPTLSCNEHVKNIKTSENIEVVEKNVVSALKEIASETYLHEEYASDKTASKSDDNDEDEFIPPGQEKKPEFYTQESLNDFIRDLGLPKDGAEHLALDLKKTNLVMKGTQSTVYKSREKAFLNFCSRESDLVHCPDVNRLMNELKANIYKDEEWRLFIDSFPRSLEAVLIHNTVHTNSTLYHFEGKLCEYRESVKCD